MAITIEQVTNEALMLSTQERAELAHTLLCSLDPSDDPAEVAAAWEAEIARRVECVHDGTAKGLPAEDVFREIRARYP